MEGKRGTGEGVAFVAFVLRKTAVWLRAKIPREGIEEESKCHTYDHPPPPINTCK